LSKLKDENNIPQKIILAWKERERNNKNLSLSFFFPSISTTKSVYIIPLVVVAVWKFCYNCGCGIAF
jgi:hypothetical protein